MRTTASLLRMREVRARTGLSRSTIYQRVAEGKFPRPVSIGERAIAWPDDEIAQWIADRVREGREAASHRAARDA
jgi:prophage regulatory protein